jgi:hypothetical protein
MLLAFGFALFAVRAVMEGFNEYDHPTLYQPADPCCSH